jgi:sec-independent protein translocase protein TatA
MFRNPTTDLIVVLVIGPKRLPGLGKSLGTGMREFKDSITGESKDDEEQHPAISASSANSEPAPSAPAQPPASVEKDPAEVASKRAQ